MTTLEALEAAKARIDTPEKWKRSTIARAARQAAEDSRQFVDVINAINGALPAGCLEFIDLEYDPSTTHADVMALFERAIAAEKGKVSQ